MSAQGVNNQVVGLTISILGSAMLAAENGRQRAVAREQRRQEIIAQNARIARIRAARRRSAAAVAAQIEVGQGRMARWLERVAH